MGFSLNQRHTPLEFENKRSPRYGRTAPTKRQRNIWRFMAAQCPHSLSFQIGGGQCGQCGKFTYPWGNPHPDRRHR